MMNLWISAFFAAASTSASDASRAPSWMFSRSEVWNRTLSWNTTAIWERSESRVTLAMSTPSIVTLPRCGSWKRSSRLSSVLLPAPLGPTMATRVPAGIARSSPSIWAPSPP